MMTTTGKARIADYPGSAGDLPESEVTSGNLR